MVKATSTLYQKKTADARQVENEDAKVDKSIENKKQNKSPDKIHTKLQEAYKYCSRNVQKNLDIAWSESRKNKIKEKEEAELLKPIEKGGHESDSDFDMWNHSNNNISF